MRRRPPIPLSSKAKLLEGEILAPLTSLQVGGPAELLLLPAEAEDVRNGIEFAVRAGQPWRILGSGTNVLVPDEGLPGLTIKFWKQFAAIEVGGAKLRARAGATTWEAAKAAADAGLSGLEFACGIPGTVGGAVFMNAGVEDREIKDILISATVLGRTGKTVEIPAGDLELGYRTSKLQETGAVVIDALFRLQRGDSELITAEMNRYLDERRQRQPINQPNCGSVFRNPPGDFAGRLIEAAGCKGMTAGGMEVSELHANFLVNTGGGSSKDVLELIEAVRREVLEKFGVLLELELRILE